MLSEQPDRRLRMSAPGRPGGAVPQPPDPHRRAGWRSAAGSQREACAGDRRGVELVLTDDGARAITAMARVHVASVREHLLSHLSRAQFLALGGAMTAIAEGIAASPACEAARADEPA